MGGSGYLGRNIIKKAISKKWKIVSISRKRNQNVIKNPLVENLFFDVSNLKKTSQLKKYKFDYVINTSGYVDHSTFSTNGISIINNHLISVINLVSVLNKSKLKRFIQIGSSEEYGLSSNSNENQREDPISTYSFSKVSSTHFLQMMSRSEKFPVTILRLFLVYGPGQKDNRLIPFVIKKCLNGEKFKVSKGDQIRDFLYISDVVDAIFLSLNVNSVNGNIYNLGSGKGRSVRSIIKLINEDIGRGKPLYGFRKTNRTESRYLVANVKKIKKDLKWSSKVEIEDGLTKTINYFNEN